MEYDLLLDKIQKKVSFLETYGNQTFCPDLIDIRILTKTPPHFKESTLYLCTTDYLPDASIKDSFSIFCYGRPVDFSIYDSSTFNIAYFGEDISQADLFNIIIEKMTAVPQISIWMNTLMNLLFSGKGLQHLIDAAAQIFGNPIYVVDLQNKYLAISSGIFPNNEFLKQENESTYVSTEGVLFIRRNRLDEKVRKSKLPIYFFNEMIGYGTLLSSICIDGIEVGHIMIQESEHKFRETDAEFLYHFTRLVSIELQKNSVFTDNKGVMYSYFLADLLKNPNANVATVQKRLNALGYKLKPNLYILVIPSSSFYTSTLRLEVVLQSIRNILVGSLYVVYENSIVFLISKEKYEELSEFELDRLTTFLENNQLKAGISNFFEKLEEAPRFYKQALEALKQGTYMNDPAPIYYFKDYYIYQILHVLEQNDSELRYLIHPGLMQLYFYDQEKGTDFIHTLKEYLICPGQPSVVAQNLHIHKNTLLYRMGKIKEITKCDFITGEDFMKFNLSFKVMEYLHMI